MGADGDSFGDSILVFDIVRMRRVYSLSLLLSDYLTLPRHVPTPCFFIYFGTLGRL